MDASRQELRIAGFGGQGIILAGYLLGKAAALYDEREACVTQAYGPEARGGACHADVIVSRQPILYPMVTTPDVLILMSQEACDRYGRDAGADTLVLTDEDLVQAGEGAHPIPATRTARELGNRLGANTVMLGVLVGLTGVVSAGALEEAIRTTVRSRFVDFNLQTLARGVEYGRALAGGERAGVASSGEPVVEAGGGEGS